MFFVRNPETNERPGSSPRVGVEFGGSRVDFTVDDIIAVEGERVPASADARKIFKMAFVLVAAPGQSAKPESIAKLQGIVR